MSVTKDYVNILMFSFDHCLIDGVSCIKFSKQFLNYMNKLANSTAHVDQELPSLNMLLYFHDIVTQKRMWHSVLKFMLRYFGLRRF